MVRKIPNKVNNNYHINGQFYNLLYHIIVYTGIIRYGVLKVDI